MQHFLDTANSLADLSGDILRKYYRATFSVESKSDTSLVTEADHAVEQALRRAIMDAYPDHGIIGEEGESHQPDAEYCWVLDPIDGTSSFAAGRPLFTTLIALCRNSYTPPLRGGVEGAFATSGEGDAKPYPPTHIQRAKDLRSLSTEAEKILWQKLRSKQFHHFKFRRQQPIGPYIADFACMERKLIIELDGGQHALEQKQDNVRMKFLEKEGFTVLRFWNNDVVENMEGVWERLERNLINHPPPEPQSGSDPSPQGRGLVPILGIIDQPISRERWVGDNHTATLNGEKISVSKKTSLADCILATTSPDLFSREGKTFFDDMRSKVKQTIYGGDGYNYALLASGQIDLVIEEGLKIHDVMALIPIIIGAGGSITDWERKPITHNFGISISVIATGCVQADALL